MNKHRGAAGPESRILQAEGRGVGREAGGRQRWRALAGRARGCKGPGVHSRRTRWDPGQRPVAPQPASPPAGAPLGTAVARRQSGAGAGGMGPGCAKRRGGRCLAARCPTGHRGPAPRQGCVPVWGPPQLGKRGPGEAPPGPFAPPQLRGGTAPGGRSPSPSSLGQVLETTKAARPLAAERPPHDPFTPFSVPLACCPSGNPFCLPGGWWSPWEGGAGGGVLSEEKGADHPLGPQAKFPAPQTQPEGLLQGPGPRLRGGGGGGA